jgi:hypothetical protein
MNPLEDFVNPKEVREPLHYTDYLNLDRNAQIIIFSTPLHYLYDTLYQYVLKRPAMVVASHYYVYVLIFNRIIEPK